MLKNGKKKKGRKESNQKYKQNERKRYKTPLTLYEVELQFFKNRRDSYIIVVMRRNPPIMFVNF